MVERAIGNQGLLVLRRLLPVRFVLLLFAVGCAPSTPAWVDDGAGNPRCAVTEKEVVCAPRVTPLAVNEQVRDVYWQTPVGELPATGAPAVIVYQGSFFAPSSTWGRVPAELAFGGYQQARLQALLLEHGFTVIAPAAAAGLAWQTNSGLSWKDTSDQPFIDELLAAISRGDFGVVDTSRLYATGISSGGYMTSRMALSYPGTFRALAIQSGGWATCVSVACALPEALPSGHPPTRFLHGRADLTVPLFTVESYPKRLVDDAVDADLIIDDAVGHAWLPESPERVVEWFEAH